MSLALFFLGAIIASVNNIIDIDTFASNNLSLATIGAGLVLIKASELQTLITDSVTDAVNAALTKKADPFSHLPEMLTRHQAAEVLGVCIATMDNWTKAGKIKKERLGGRTVRFRKSDLLSKKQSLVKHSR